MPPKPLSPPLHTLPAVDSSGPETAAPEKPEIAISNPPGNIEPQTPNRSAVQKEKKGKTSDKETREDKNRKPRRKVKKGKLKWEQNLSIQAGPALAVKSLTARRGVVIPSGYLDGRKATEHGLESFTAGLFYSAATRNGLVLKAGLDYRQINEKFHLAYTEKKTQINNGVLTQTVDGAGNIIHQTTGPKTVTMTTEYSYKAYNHYRFINLPIGTGYRHSTKKSRWELSGGLDVNLFFRTGGAIYNRYLEPTTLKSGGLYYDEVFRRNTGLGAWVSWSYCRKLSDQLWWQISANAQAPLSPVSKSEYELIQRYFNFGVQAGVVFQIGKR